MLTVRRCFPNSTLAIPFPGRVLRDQTGGAPGPRAARRPVLASWSVVFALSLLGIAQTRASDLSVPHSFSAGTPALAAEVNANFSAVETAVDDNDARLDQLLADMATLQATVNAQAATIAALQSGQTTQDNAIAAIQASNVMGIDPYIELTDIANPNSSAMYATVRITGANLQVVDGSGDTQGAENGLGNLIVGYNQTSGSALEHCSDGQYSEQIPCEDNGRLWANNQRGGSHNLVVGNFNSYSRYGGLLAGHFSIVNGNYASVGGGSGNTASGWSSSVSGGSDNTASGYTSSVNGGSGNTASGWSSSVSGGYQNDADGNYSSVSGGRDNSAGGTYSSVSGGWNRVSGGTDDWRAGDLFEDD